MTVTEKGNALVERTDHEATAEDALAGVFQRPAMRALARAIASECKAFEGAAFDLLEARTIDESTGATKDQIGAILGETRKGRTDAAYRVAMRLLIRARLSNGKTSDLIAILDLLALDYSYREQYPAGLRVEVFATTEGPEIARWVFKARGAGVGAEVAYSEVSRDLNFAVEDAAAGLVTGNVYASVTDRALGFGLMSCRRV